MVPPYVPEGIADCSWHNIIIFFMPISSYNWS